MTTTAARTRKHSRTRKWIPPQHGVWAMLLLPYLAGLQYGVDWLQIPLLVVWLTGWLASYYALLAVKTLRVHTVWRQVLTYSAMCLVAAIPLCVFKPGLLLFSPAFAVLVLVNVVATRMGQERSTGNGFASVTMASLMALIVPATAGLDWRLGVPAAIATWLYLAGTVVYVKTMIRERGSRSHLVVSVAFHVGALAASVAVDPWLAIPFAYFLVRAIVTPRFHPKVVVVGMLEAVNALALLAFLVVRL